MERLTTWRASFWVRWLGWTVLYGLSFFGAAAVADPSQPWPYLVGLALALLIGVRFHSWWWVFGPAIALGLPFSVILIALDYAVIIALLVPYAAVLGLVAAAGVWWGKRRAVTFDDSPFERREESWP